MISDNKKIGIFLIGGAMTFYTLGIMFLFDRALLLIANLAFLMGLYCFVGVKGTIGFFSKKGNFKNSVVFFVGFGVIILRFAFFGAIIQIYSAFMLFRSFLPFLFDWLYSVPVIGPFLKNNYFTQWLYTKATSDTRKGSI